jgi:hypothetical protein
MSIEEALALGKNLLYLNFLSLAVAFYFSININKLNSTLLALGIMMVFSFLMTSYTPTLYGLSMTNKENNLHEYRLLWYIGYAFWDFLIIGLVLYSHKRFSLKRSFCATAIIFVYFIKMELHIARYIEVEFYGSDYLNLIYEKGIPGINMVLAAVIFGFVITVLGSFFISKTTKFRGAKWNI